MWGSIRGGVIVQLIKDSKQETMHGHGARYKHNELKTNKGVVSCHCALRMEMEEGTTYNSRTHGSAEACKSSKQTAIILLLLLEKKRSNDLLATFTRTRSWWRRREQECRFRDQDDSTHSDRRGSCIQRPKGFLQNNPPQDRCKRRSQKENYRRIRQRHDAKRIEEEPQPKRTRKASTE